MARGQTHTFRFSTEPSVSEASNHTHPQPSEQKGFPPCALDATMRNTNATMRNMNDAKYERHHSNHVACSRHNQAACWNY